MSKINVISLCLFLCFAFCSNKQAFSQEHKDFEIIKQIKTTPVKDQNHTGTCWSYATISFIETEALRIKNQEFDLSEMFIVANAYKTKADKYVRFHGNANFSEGGQAHDVLNEVRKYGLVPQKSYSGINYNSAIHVHAEMVAMLKGMLEGVIQNKQKKLTKNWKNAVEAVLEVYLGKLPKKVSFENKDYSPKEFAREIVGFNPEDYVELTSYSHHPYYSKFDLEIPDNWSHDLYYNLPIDELMEVFNYAIDNNYSICWDGDVSEKDFSHRLGYAKLKDGTAVKDYQQERQQTFNNWVTTDDHLMHLTGKAKDKDGVIYYQTKNSWNDDSNKFGGYLYMSEPYVRVKTVAVLVHKNAIPKKIRKKLNL